MKKKFPLFQNHLDLVHNYLSRVLKKGDCAIDATCGNGHDTLFLVEQCLTENEGYILSMDIQRDALQAAEKKISEFFPKEIEKRVTFFHGCHSNFPITLIKNPIKAIVYNLGYLPGGDKSITTHANTTIQSIEAACDLIDNNGIISITCYPGHPEGLIEEELILNYISKLSSFDWNCCYHQWPNRRKSPSLVLLQKCNSH